MRRPPLVLIFFYLSAFVFITLAAFSCAGHAAADPSAQVADADFSGDGITLPYFKLHSSDADSANTELEKLFKSWREWSADGITITSTYTTAARGDMLSVLITETFNDSVSTSCSYYSYNFDTVTGKRVAYPKFLAEFGITADQAELYIKEAAMALASGWTDDSFMPYQTLRGAFAQTVKNYTDAVDTDYLTFYIGEDGAPYAAVTVVTPDGSNDTKIALTSSDASQLLRGKWTLDAGDRVYELNFDSENMLTLTSADAFSGETKICSGSYSASTDGISLILNYDFGDGFTGSMHVSGTLINEFIVLPLKGRQLAPGEYTYVETAAVYDDTMTG